MVEQQNPIKSGRGKKPGTKNRALEDCEQVRLVGLRLRLKLALEHARTNGGDDSLFEALGEIRTVERWAGIAPGSEAHKFRPHNIRQIEKFLELIERKTHYQYLADEIGQRPHNLGAIAAFQGDYFFFRYRPEAGGCIYSRGHLKISFDASKAEAAFEQWSGNYNRHKHSRRAEHNGYVFLKGGKMYFAGRRAGVMRLGIVKLPAGEDPKHWYMAGVVASVADDDVPFAAKVLLVPAKNRNLVRRLSQEGKQLQSKAVAESNFLKGVATLEKDKAFLRLSADRPFLSED